ncbi:MAG: hypothetical protein II671_08540, partial [Salinivirgaceae bacterium]|nr:hypothetical protein [Salinivirgaceae bacterium]
MQIVLYPLKFKPIFKDKIWGGHKIKDVLGMDYGRLPNCGEVWLLSGLWDEQSLVDNGDFEGDEINDLVETFMGDLVGESVFDKSGEQFPLLLKIIDANDWLRVAGIFYNLHECDGTDDMLALGEELQPMMSQHSLDISLNEKL